MAASAKRAGTSQPGNGGLDRQQSGKTEHKAEAVDESGQARETRPQAPVRKSGAGTRPAQGDGRDATASGSHGKAFSTGCRGTATDSSGLRVHMVRGHGAGQHPPCDVQYQQQSTTPDQISKPPYITMMECILTEFKARVMKTTQGPAMKATAVSAGLCTDQDQWVFKRWNPAQKTLVLTNTQPLPSQTLVSMLDTMLKDIQEPGALRKFHASRQLQEDMTGDKAEVCFTIQVALRGAAAERLCASLVQLCDCMALRLLKSRLRFATSTLLYI